MKIRTGFVSNSSSSSFVLAIKKESTKPLVIKIPIEEVFDDGLELSNFIKENKNARYPRDENELEELKEACLPYADTHNFIEVTLDQYEDAMLIEALSQKQKDVIVIEGE